MKLTTTLIAAALLFAVHAHAHDCSGGTDGGTDATGNQCNDLAQVTPDAAGDAASAAVERWRDEGLAAYERGRPSEAVPYLRRAAEHGDARSAEILALVYRFGPRLYPGMKANAAEAAKWAAVAAEARQRELATPMASR